MTMTRDKIERMRADMQGVGDHCAWAFRVADLRPLLALAERALEPQGQALPVAWRAYDHDDGKWFLFQTEAEAKSVWPSKNISQPLYASQLALPAGPVPDAATIRDAALEEAARLFDQVAEKAEKEAAWFDAEYSKSKNPGALSGRGATRSMAFCASRDAAAIRALKSSPAVAQPVADEQDAERIDWMERQHLQDLLMMLIQDAPYDGKYYVEGDNGARGYGDTLREAIDAARVALCPPAEEGDKA